MSKFIELACDGEPKCVNVDQVVSFYPVEKGCSIVTVVGTIGVDEPYEVVKKKITE